MKQGDTIELTPTKLTKRGMAEGECEGRRVRVAGAFPGEAARATVTHVSKGGPVAEAKFVEPVGEPHPGRHPVRCPIHDRCGGCGLQHISEVAVLQQKVADARALLDAPFEDAIASPRAFGYRAKTFLLPQNRGRHLLLGARPPRGRYLVDTSDCAVLRPELEALAARTRAVLAQRPEEDGHLRAAMLRCNRKRETQVTFTHTGDAGWLEEAVLAVGADAAFLQRHDAPGNRICSDEDERPLIGAPIVERFGDAVDAVVPPTAFCQGNPDVAEALYERAAQELQGDRIAELYCGAAVAGLLALRRNEGAQLIAIDRSPRAIDAAIHNAELNELVDRCTFEVGAAESFDAQWDAVLVNPPRAGCHEAVLDAVARSDAHKLVYLSCNAQTLARDAARLGWTCTSVTPADMFPQTPHLELLAVFTRP